MIIFLILGVLLGAVSVMFVFQNITPVTISFLMWQMNGSLATVLFLALMTGVFITLLFILPSFIRDELRYRRLKKEAEALKDELVAAKKAIVPPVPPPMNPDISV
ncbi:MAG: LapA family protein [Minisyncoccia bacterium]